MSIELASPSSRSILALPSIIGDLGCLRWSDMVLIEKDSRLEGKRTMQCSELRFLSMRYYFASSIILELALDNGRGVCLVRQPGSHWHSLSIR